MSDCYNLIPVILVLLPMLGALGIMFAASFGSRWRNIVTNGLTFATFALALVQFFLVQKGFVLVYALEGFMEFGLRWRVDFISATFALVVATVWLLATVYARDYMADEEHQTRFFGFSTFTLGATLGVFVAGDLFSLFLFFELMTFAAYVLVIHEQNDEAMRAGNVYLYMSVAGGLALLGVIFLLQFVAGATGFEPALHLLVANDLSPWLIMVMLIGGFGVKAGMIPLHIWLPKAHPVAPAPASALLSAIMIKTGAYGFLRFLLMILTVPDGNPLFVFQQNFGYLFIWIGAITMFVGAIMAILNDSMKRILAYSSISQMGYILFALGSGVLLGSRGVFGFAGAWMHMINHAFFKSFLFLLAGAVYLQTGELDLDKLGGLRKKMPLALGFFLIAAASITGIPGFNGYVSKVVIHEAILEAYHLLSWPSLLWLERIFVLTGGLTAAYISKIWLKTFFGKEKVSYPKARDLSSSHLGVFGFYTLISVVIGVFAQGAINKLVLPATKIFAFNQADLAHLREIPFWDIHELTGPLISYGIAFIALIIVFKFAKYLNPPRYLSVEFLVYRPIYNLFRNLIRFLIYLGDSWLPKRFAALARFWQKLGIFRRRLVIKLKTFRLPKNPFTRENLGKKLEIIRQSRQRRRELWLTKREEFLNFFKTRKSPRLVWEELQEKRQGQRKNKWRFDTLSFDVWVAVLVVLVAFLVFLLIR